MSVIVPFYNAGSFLGEAIQSVLVQSYANWELLLVDDGSTDESSDIAQNAAAGLPDKVRYVQHPGGANRGACASRNEGIVRTTGELIAPLDADDVWLPKKLEEQVDILRRHPEAGMVYGLARYWYSWTGEAQNATDPIPRGAAFLGELVRPPALNLASYPLGTGMTPCPSDLLIHRSVVEHVGGFEESFTGPLQLYEDQAFLAKVFLATPVFVADYNWILYRQHPDSCVAAVSASGEARRVKEYFLHWYGSYLEKVTIADQRVRRAVTREIWLHRHPHLHNVRNRVRRLPRALRQLRRRVGAVILRDGEASNSISGHARTSEQRP